MAKFRFPGKALKLNTRKRVRFRGSHAGSTPEELYTRRIRRGLDLFTQIFGESDEDEDDFEGFSSVHPESKEVKNMGKKVFESPSQKEGKRSAQKVEDACAALEGSGLVTRKRTCVAEMAVRNLRDNVEKNKDISECEERTDIEVGYVESVCDSKTIAATSQTSLTLGSDKCSEGTKTSVVATLSHVTRKQANHRLSRPPTVKTALAKKLLAKAKKKAPSLPVVGEKSPKRFILPTMSVRSSRIIKPNKRLFADITEMCSTSSSLEAHGSTEAGEDSISVPSKRLVKLTHKGRGSHTQFLSLPRSRTQSKNSLSGMEGVGRDSMRRTISLYTESMTGPSKGQVGRPPKRLLRRLETPQQDVEAEVPDSPQRCDPKESRVKEKIEKLLRSPWDDRLKQSGKVGKAEDELMPAPATNTSPALSASVISRNILRKARLNLNKTTLQKIRNPASLQRLIPQCDEGNVEGKCATCDIAGGNSRKFGIVFCEVCSSFLRNASDGPREIFECQNSKGECQIQGLVEEDRCLACWLYRILLSCSMPNLLHDRLRKRLPTILKEQIPTSLARCMSIGGLPTVLEKEAELASHTKRLTLDPGGGGAFGSVMDLPGGWRRKTGPEVIVISPSGEKFKSVQKLEEFLKKQGISTDARVLFGNNSPAIDRSTEVKSRPSTQTNSTGRGKVVMTTLPGGWTRRIKWRSAGDRFDTYVYSPDGRTFRSRRELSAHFQVIGKVDDIHKYFPVVTGHSDASVASSSDTPGSSSTEPVSSSEPCSEVSSDDKSPEASECEAEQPKFKDKKSVCNNEKSKFSHIKQLKIKSHKEQGQSRSKSVSKLKTTDISEEPAGQLNSTDVMNEVMNLERKHKKTKIIMRSRSLSVGRKKMSDDASLTDTTESESEQRKSGASTIFSKAFSRSRSKTKPKAIDSQSPLVENSLTTSVGAPDQRLQELNDSKVDAAVELEDVAKRLDTPDEGFKELCNTKTDIMETGDAAKKLANKKHKKTVEETSVFIKPNVISSEKQLEHKIVLKIPKKAIRPVGKKHRNRNKRVESDCLTVGGNDKGVAEHLKVQDNVEVERKHKDKIKHGERDSPTMIRDDKGAVEQPSVKDATEVIQDTDQGVVAQISSTTKSFDLTQSKQSNLVHEDPIDMESDSLVGYMSVDSKVSSPNASEGEAVPDVASVPEVKSKPKTKRLSSYETCRFGNGWSRKIRWSEKGEGKVALLHSPDSQTFRSRIELLAYFKKAGRSKVDLDFYFPPVLKREQTSLSSRATKVRKLPSIESSSVTAVTSTSAQSSEMSEFSDSETVARTSEDSSISGEESKRPSIPKVIRCFRKVGGQYALKSIPENVSEESTFQNQVIKISGSVPVLSDETRKPLSQLSKNGRKVIIVSTQDGKSSVKTETEDAEGTVNESGGPRVKHVCRSQAQVLGIPRALFPSPKKEEDRLTGIVSVPSNKGNQKRKIVTVTTTASGKVLRKTQWCSKCPGCTTPNCLKCVNCLDMKKYGGPGTKKKPCVMRKCHNPRLSVKSAISQESTTKVPHQVITTTVLSPTTVKEARKVPVINVKVQEDKIELPEASIDSVSKSLQQEKGVFIPRHVTRTQPDQKDRGDIAAGKQFVPGTLVNIDYWQGYDADEMMLTGYPVTTASSLHPQVLCFRCGSVGKEQLLYCAWCCEGIHPYCLEDGEGPESEVEEVFWICRRCAVCHVCGAPGADSLLRCSDCRNYYHMECLGPSAHSTCQPTPDRPWKCVTCTRCTSCGSPNVGQWQKVPFKVKPMEVTMGEASHTTDLSLCARCITLRERGNFCPLCNGCYEDDDYDAKMMECGRCGEWIHAHCEGLNNERYQILSFLPDTVEYVCRNCVVDTASSWLDAVTSELLAGCEAVLQALLSSRCAKHLVKREASKVSSSGGLTPIPLLPPVGIPSLERSDDLPLEKIENAESLVSVASSKRTVTGESLNTASSESYQSGKLIHSGRNSMISTETGANYSLSETEGVCGSSSINQMGISVDSMDINSSQTSCKSTKCTLEIDKDFESPLCSVNINVTDIPQDESSELSKLTGKQVLCSDYSQHEIMAAISDEGKVGCITDAKDKIDVKGKATKDKYGEDVRIPTRRQTRTSSAGVAISSYAAISSASSDPIKLKECSVRLEDICKSKSPSSSPIKNQSSEQNTTVRSEAETCKETEPIKSQEVEGTNVKPICGKALECLQSLGEKELEGVTREALHGIMSLKDTDVSCTQVDGPNDETTATARVIRTLLFEDRSQMMLGTTGLLESKNENNEEKNLTHVETQLISPKDKITKDIDDDCVSSEESSFCDTDTEIESIQDDPEEPRDLLSVKEKLKDRKYDSVLQFHVDMIRVIENGRHLNRSQTRNVQATYAKHMKECFPWFDVKTANVFELVDKQRPFPIPHTDHNYIFRTLISGSRHFTMRDAPVYRKRSTSPQKGALIAHDRRKCVLCGRESDDDPNAAGRLLYLGQDEWLHVNCGLWSSEVYEEVDGSLQNVYLAVSRGRLIKCSACLERGATVGCCHKSCQATYHFLCARRSCCQFMDDKRIFCPHHESPLNGEEKSDDFKVSRCVYVDMDSEKKKWKQVQGDRVRITIGSLTIKNLGRIIPESDSVEALIPIDFTCSRMYWSTVDPSKRVTYTCRTRRVVPALVDASLMGDAAFHKTIDHSLGEETVHKEMAAVKKWFKQLEERKVERKSRETNIIPPHLCPLYRSIKDREEDGKIVESVVRCHTPPAIMESDVQQCIDDIIDKVSRSVEEESLLLDTDLPAIVSADDNELISMVLNDLAACDPITLQSTPSTSGRPSPLDIDFLSTCDQMMDSGKVTHSGNMTQEAQETDCNPQVIMDTTLAPCRNPTCVAYQVESTNADIKEPLIETISPPSTQDLGPVPSCSMSVASNGNTQSSAASDNNSNITNSGNSCNRCSSESKSDGTSCSSSSESSSSSNTARESSSPERCSEGVMSNTSSPDTCSRASSENNTSTDTNSGSTDSNSGSETSSQTTRCITKSPCTSTSGKNSSSLKQICRVLPMPSTNSRRSSSASDHSDSLGQTGPSQSPPTSQQSPRHSDENEGSNATGRGSERKKICMKRNYKTVIKKYPLRSGMRKSKPYETVQIEINETIEIPGGEGSGVVHKSLKRKWSGILDSEEENCQKDPGSNQEGQGESNNHGSDGENSKENSVSKKVLKFSDDNNDITVSIVNNNNNLCEFSKSRGHRYRHKTVLQLDGAADGSSSSAEMSESQDEGMCEEKLISQNLEDPQTPPLHSALAMRIKEQSLARSSPGEEGPYKCSKCKRLYRTKESYEKHIETCTFEVDSSSTSEDDDDYEEDIQSDEEEENDGGLSHHHGDKDEGLNLNSSIMPIVENSGEFPSYPPEFITSQVAPEDFATSRENSVIDDSASVIEHHITENPLLQVQESKTSTSLEVSGNIKTAEDEPTVKKPRLDSTLPRQPGVHRQVRTAIKKCPGSGEDVELLQVVRGHPPLGTDVFVPPPVSPVKFSPIVKKSASPRRYTNIRLMRGSRGDQYRRAAPHMPTPEHYHNAGSGMPMAPPATPAPIQVTMHAMANTSGPILTQGAPASFQQFGGQSTQYPAAAQLNSPVSHLSSALQVAPQVTSQVAPQVSPQVSPQVLTMVSASSVAVPQGYTLQYVGSFRDGEMASGGGSLVTYPTAPVVVPQPQLVMTPQQSSVVVPQVVNTNITYSFTAPETLVINQPAMVPGMQSVQYLPQQQQQQQQQQQHQQQQPPVMHHTEQQVSSVMQYNESGVSTQHTQVPVSHIHSGQVHSPCIQFSDLQAGQVCMQQQQQHHHHHHHHHHQQPQPTIVSQELSFTGSGSKQLHTPQCIVSSPNRGSQEMSVNVSPSSSIGSCSTLVTRQRPQASVAPQIIRPQPVHTTTSPDSSPLDAQGHSRLPFADRPLVGGVRTVATVAPAVITTSSVVSISTCNSTTKLTSVETSPKIATVRPRPTYSYRDAMREKQIERQKQRQEMLQIDKINVPDGHPEFLKEQKGLETLASESETDSESEVTCQDAEEKEDRLETQSYKLVLRKDNSLSSGFNVLPISGPAAPLPSPEVKELRIKAKVSVGPKRKKAKNHDPEKDLIIVNKDTASDLYVNEQLPNFSINPMHNPADDPAMFEKPKTCSSEPYIVFELTSEDGFRVESRHISEVWQKVFDAVAAARASMRIDSKMPTNLQQAGPGGTMSGLHMLGLTHNAVQYLLEQLPGAKDCHKYSFQFHRRPQEEGAVEENPTGCARTEPFKTRSPYDIFSWLASKHRRMPERSLVQQEEIQLSTTRRATSLELPMAMRYRHLRETAREAVGVFRSSIHGRGLFCKRDIDAGEMVIEYAGQVIRSSLCDMREKDYESKGIGCYMFRIDDDTVIDATMHGNAARFINHSCDPNCYSRVVDILGKKHIIIFALRRILRGEELTYDYKFPIEEDKIPCTCGTRRCRKYLN